MNNDVWNDADWSALKLNIYSLDCMPWKGELSKECWLSHRVYRFDTPAPRIFKEHDSCDCYRAWKDQILWGERNCVFGCFYSRMEQIFMVQSYNRRQITIFKLDQRSDWINAYGTDEALD